jgi:hypothetical protein
MARLGATTNGIQTSANRGPEIATYISVSMLWARTAITSRQGSYARAHDVGPRNRQPGKCLSSFQPGKVETLQHEEIDGIKAWDH